MTAPRKALTWTEADELKQVVFAAINAERQVGTANLDEYKDRREAANEAVRQLIDWIADRTDYNSPMPERKIKKALAATEDQS